MTSRNVFMASIIVLLTLLGAYILISSYRILIVLTIAFIIASTVRPLVQTLIRWHLPEGLAIVITYLALVSLAVLIFIAVLPPVFSQLIGYIENDDRLANRIIVVQSFIQSLIRDVTNNQIATIDEETIRTNVALFVQQIRAATPMVINNAGGIAGDIILIFVIGVYWLTSRHKAIEFLTTISTGNYKQEIGDIIHEIESTMGNYVRGVFTVGSAVGLLNFLPLFFLGVPNALLVAMIIGITTTIPMVGGLIGGIIVVTLTLLISPQQALVVLVVFLIVQQIENNILAPRIMSERVGLDPLLVIVYTSIGLVMGGVLGALLAVPVMATVHVLLKHFVLKPYQVEISEFETENGITVIKDRDKVKANSEENGKILVVEDRPSKQPNPEG